METTKQESPSGQSRGNGERYKIFLLGVAGDRIPEIPASCDCVVCTERLVPAGFGGDIIPVAPLAAALQEIDRRLAGADVCVLASGDPLFFGIGRTLIERYGRERLEVRPAFSSLQLLCARLAIVRDDLDVVSLHGRPAVNIPAAVLGRRRVAIFTDRTSSPDRVAAALLEYFKALDAPHLAQQFRIGVGERLGCADERLLEGDLWKMAATAFRHPNIMVLEDRSPAGENAGFGLGEQEIRHSRGLITKDEVRAVTLHRLRLPATGVFWDIGAGSGSISLEAAAISPGLYIYAVERKPEELANIRANIVQYRRFTITPVAGGAPDILKNLPDPDRVFIGGSGGHLAAVIASAAARLRPGGRLVINAVTDRTVAEAPRLLATHGLTVRSCRLRVHRVEQDVDTEFNPITIITGQR